MQSGNGRHGLDAADRVGAIGNIVQVIALDTIGHAPSHFGRIASLKKTFKHANCWAAQ